MTITDSAAVDYGFLVAFAEGMYVLNKTDPRPEPRIAAAGWNVVGHLLAQDALLPGLSTPQGQRKLSLGPTTVFSASSHAARLTRTNTPRPSAVRTALLSG
ncbi:MAG: hypothetical protein ACLQF1_18490 [Methyloceanibacter sp.]